MEITKTMVNFNGICMYVYICGCVCTYTYKYIYNTKINVSSLKRLTNVTVIKKKAYNRWSINYTGVTNKKGNITTDLTDKKILRG